MYTIKVREQAFRITIPTAHSLDSSFLAKPIGKVTNISKKGEKGQSIFVLEMSGDFF